MTTSSLLSTPPLRMRPELACLLRVAEEGAEDFLTGDTGRLGTMKGLEASARLLGAKKDAESGVFVSERERPCLVGVFGG